MEAGAARSWLTPGARFIAEHYWDAQQDGWFWIADRAGTPMVLDKVGYGQCFGIYAFSEYFLATGDPLGKEMALRSYDAVCRHMADTRYGGYLELFTRRLAAPAAWQIRRGSEVARRAHAHDGSADHVLRDDRLAVAPPPPAGDH